MATFIPALNTVRVVFNQTQVDGSPCINRIHVTGTAAWDDSTLTDLAETCASKWHADLGADISHDIKLVSVAARDLTTETSGSVIFNPVTDNVGENTDGQTVLGTTYAITMRTGLAGIGNRGRWFWNGVPTGALDPDVSNGVLAASATNMASDLMSLFTDIISDGPNGSQVVIASFYEPPTVDGHSTPRDTANLVPVTSTGFHDLFLDFQRRRAPGHNIHR